MKKKLCMIAYTKYVTDARVRREAEALAADSRFEVTVLALKASYNPRKYTLKNVEVIELNTKKYTDRHFIKYLFSYIEFAIRAFFSCTNLLLTGNIDIVHVHNMPNFLVFSAILAKLCGKKTILDLHDTVPETFGAKFDNSSNIGFRLFSLEERISCSLADNLICVNHVQREALVKRGIPADKIFVSMNVPDHKIFSANHRNLSTLKKDSAFKIAYHGTVTRRLGVDLVIHAVSRLQEKIPSIEFHIWGGGDLLNQCIELTRTLGIETHIYFHAPVPLDTLPQVLREMDLGVVANRKNLATDLMLPVKMLEYIALDIPVVAPRLHTINYYFRDGMVSYFKPNDVESLSSVIYSLYNNPLDRKQQTRMARQFLEQYGWQTHSKEFIRYYYKLSNLP